MKYFYEDLGDRQFEDLVIGICHFLLGPSVKGFAAGPDGGRDAYFNGTADRFPSTGNRWTGKTVIQAKHTNGRNKHFSESGFFNPKDDNSELCREAKKVKTLIEKGELNNYMLFSNRRLTANTHESLLSYFSEKCDLDHYHLYFGGVEDLDKYLRAFPGAHDIAGIAPCELPLIIDPANLAEVVERIAGQLGSLKRRGISQTPTERIHFNKKNEINNLSIEYAERIRRRYLPYTNDVADFLSDPVNADYRDYYETASDELESQLAAESERGTVNFEHVIETFIQQAIDRDSVLSSNRRLTRIMFFYMYWHCDIGRNPDDSA